MSNTMTPERAIKKHNELIEYLKHSLEIDSDCCLLDKDKQMIILALKYRIPKKPIFDEEMGVYYCPGCKRVQAYAVDDFADYCELCGQAIDRSLDGSDEE